ncbi:DUF4907 domain-containing protein [uncultured Bacteroides sp.]|uniref:DUF4907 domain-containing protein n=1 Tax=uncultured Bacteroides sp. TaxID=162156 RepID=UPI0025F690D2|nr:DUF4907 domain-containing protein [uncultured Bacteroides sp.]
MKLMFIVKLGVLSVVAVCLSCCSGRKSAGSREFACRPVQVVGGYGYVVLHQEDTLIYQPYIPAIGRRVPFASEEDALKVGGLVCRKLMEGQPPTVSREEIVEKLPFIHRLSGR